MMPCLVNRGTRRDSELRLQIGKTMPTSKKPMAIKTSKAEAAGRKVDRMFDDHAKADKRRNVGPRGKPMAVKTNKADQGRRKTDTKKKRGKPKKLSQAERGQLLKNHFKKLFSGKISRMQGKK